MGYRSDIRIVMKKKDYPKFSKYVEDYIAEKQAQYNLMEHIDVKEEGTQTIYIGWNYLKWYEEYPEVQAVHEALDKFRDEGLSFAFARIGEDYGDYEEDNNNYDLPFPQLVQYFDDALITAELD